MVIAGAIHWSVAMPDSRTYLVVGRVQKQVKQSVTESPCEMKLEAVSINDAMEKFKAKAAQAGWQRAWIATVEAITYELAG